MADPTGEVDLIAVGPVTVPDGVTGGALRTFEAFVVEARAAGLAVQVVDTGQASVPALARRLPTVWVAARLVGLVATNARRRRPVIWFLSGGMLRWLSPLLVPLSWTAPVVVMTFGGWLGEVVPGLPGWHRRAVVGSLGRARLVGAQSERTVRLARAAGVRRAAATGVMRCRPETPPRLDVGDADGPVHLVYAGRVEPRKGIEALVDVVAAADGHLTADVIGPVDPGAAALVRLAADPPPGVRFLGQQPHDVVLAALAAADLSVLLSTYPGEGLPGSVVESLQLGTPAVVSDHLALPELVEDGVSGFVVSPTADGWPVADLAERLGGLDADARRALRAGAAAAGAGHGPDRWLPLLVGPLGLTPTGRVAEPAAGPVVS